MKSIGSFNMMQTIKMFLKPDSKRLVLFGGFLLLLAGAFVQAWALSKGAPKPFLVDVLGKFPFWVVWVMLSVPVHMVSPVFSGGGPGRYAYLAANLVYFYLFACLLAASFESYAGRFRKWLWAFIVLLPVMLPALGSFIPFLKWFSRGWGSMFSVLSLVEAGLSVLGMLLVAWIYLYLAVCAVYYFCDRFFCLLDSRFSRKAA